MESIRSEKVYYYLLMLAAAIVASGLSFAVYVPIAALLLWLLWNGYEKKNVRLLKKLPALMPVLLYLMVIAGFFFASNRTKALSSLSVYLPYLLPALLIAGPSLSVGWFTKIIKAFILGLSISLFACDLYGIVDTLISGQSMISVNEGPPYFKLYSFGLTRLFHDWHPTYVSLFAVWAIIMLLTYSMYYKTAKLFNPAIQVILSIFLAVNIFLLGSIAAIFALSIILAWIFLRYRAHKGIKVYAIILLVAFFMASISLLVYFNPFNNYKIATLKERGFTITDREGDRNFLTIRLAKWITHVQIFKEHPVWGSTAGDLQEKRKKVYLEKGFDSLAKNNFNAHNEYLDILCRFGLIGFTLFIILLFAPLLQKQSIPFYMPVLLACLVVFLTESFLERQQGQIAFMFIYGLLNKPLSTGQPLRSSIVN